MKCYLTAAAVARGLDVVFHDSYRIGRESYSDHQNCSISGGCVNLASCYDIDAGSFFVKTKVWLRPGRGQYMSLVEARVTTLAEADVKAEATTLAEAESWAEASVVVSRTNVLANKRLKVILKSLQHCVNKTEPYYWFLEGVAKNFWQPSPRAVEGCSGKHCSRFVRAPSCKGSRSDEDDAKGSSSAHIGGTPGLGEVDPFHRRMLLVGGVPCLGDRFGVTPIMGVNEYWRIIRAEKHPEETGVAQVSKKAALSEARSRAEEELEASLKRCYVKGEGLEGQSCSGPGGEGRGCYGGAEPGLECLKEDATGLLSNFAVARAERHEAVNNAEASRVEASGLSTELVASRSEVKGLRARGVNPHVNGVEYHTKLEVARGETSLLHGRVALLELREVELLSESEAAQAKVARL
ncbi:hypothetical protein ACLOJK_034367 [Asimina triloba]